MRDRCAALRTLFQCVCTQHRNRIGQLSPFSEYAPTAGWIKPTSTATFKGACYPPVRGGRDRCREAVAACASCALFPTGGTNVPTAEWGACVGQEQCGRYIYPDKVGHAGNASYLVRRAVRREGFFDAGAVAAAARRDRSRDIREPRS